MLVVYTEEVPHDASHIDHCGHLGTVGVEAGERDEVLVHHLFGFLEYDGKESGS